jgi:glyoxylase-like metal-dependent hydrolase (beta-lactamase superfamily II)
MFHHPTPHVYYLSPDETTDRPILGAVCGESATLMLDAGTSPAHAGLFLAELVNLNITPPRYLTVTHWHWDHIFGASAINALFFAHEETQKKINLMARLDWNNEALDQRVAAGTEVAFCAEMIKKEYPGRRKILFRIPDLTFTHQVNFDLGGVSCQYIHVGGDHCSDSCVLYVPEDRVVFISDCLFSNSYINPPHYLYTAGKLFPLIDRLLSFDADIYLFGHDEEPVTRKGLIEYTDRLKEIGECVINLGGDREKILADLNKTLESAISEEDIETMDAFIAGIKLDETS